MEGREGGGRRIYTLKGRTESLLSNYQLARKSAGEGKKEKKRVSVKGRESVVLVSLTFHSDSPSYSITRGIVNEKEKNEGGGKRKFIGNREGKRTRKWDGQHTYTLNFFSVEPLYLCWAVSVKKEEGGGESSLGRRGTEKVRRPTTYIP